MQSISEKFISQCFFLSLDISPLIDKRLLDNPLPDDKILDWSKLTQIADNILKFI